MSPEFLARVLSRGEAVQERWRTLLHIEPVSGPLANPEALQHYIPRAFSQILALLGSGAPLPKTLKAARAELPACDCGHNPYRAFFSAAEQALAETAVLVQAAQTTGARSEEDLAALIFAVRSVARQEIDTFCSACVHRGRAARCRFRQKS